MRALVTGAGGFVGPYVIDALRQAAAAVEIVAAGKPAESGAGSAGVVPLDVTHADEVRRLLEQTRPSHVIHLAGIAAPVRANVDRDLTWSVNLGGTLNIARAVLDVCPGCTLINVGSGMVYGATANRPAALDEDALLAPMDDYAASKAAADLALGPLVRQGLRCVRMRPFNHTGAGQTDSFVVPAFAVQIARIEAGLAEPVVRVGNLEAERDFLDVRDVARAYALAALRSDELESGLILNIASGTPRRTRAVLDRLLALSSVRIRVEQDPGRMRPSDVPRMVGDASRARELLGWTPRHDFDDTLRAVLEDCRARVAASRKA